MDRIGKIKVYPSTELQPSIVSIGFECLDRDMFKAEMCYDTLGKTGVKYARCQTGWAKCEKEKGVYDFTWLDDIIDNLLSRGIQPWFNVSYGNPLYTKNISTASAVGCVPIIHGEEAMEAWKKYIVALANHYKDRIQMFEIWNEPDTTMFWYPDKADPVLYAKFVEISGDIIRNIIPDCKIGGCISAKKWDYMEDFFETITP